MEGMELLSALTALRSLTLPEQRVRTLCAVAAQARTGIERAGIVRNAQNEAARNRARVGRELVSRARRAQQEGTEK